MCWCRPSLPPPPPCLPEAVRLVVAAAAAAAMWTAIPFPTPGASHEPPAVPFRRGRSREGRHGQPTPGAREPLLLSRGGERSARFQQEAGGGAASSLVTPFPPPLTGFWATGPCRMRERAASILRISCGMGGRRLRPPVLLLCKWPQPRRKAHDCPSGFGVLLLRPTHNLRGGTAETLALYSG